jgi:dephospho-CoA kinase
MIKVAITGSIGMGKSTVAAMFERAGIPLFDADAEVRRLQGEGGALVEPIGAVFPGSIKDGRIDREALSRAVIGNPRALSKLEAIVHPAVRAARDRFIAGNSDASILLFDIPLLFETGGEINADKIIVVSAPAEVQRARVLARPGMTPAKLEGILARQMPDSEKRRRADFVIDTGGTMEQTAAQVDAIIACLKDSTER